MGRDVYKSYPSAKQVIEEAEEALGNHVHLRSVMFDGPPQTLTQTENAQPGMYFLKASLHALWRCG